MLIRDNELITKTVSIRVNCLAVFNCYAAIRRLESTALRRRRLGRYYRREEQMTKRANRGYEQDATESVLIDTRVVSRCRCSVGDRTSTIQLPALHSQTRTHQSRTI